MHSVLTTVPPCTTITARAPELLLGQWSYCPAQDVWSCGLIFAGLCRCEGMDQGQPCVLAEYEGHNLGETNEVRDALGIFQRLGTPAPPHPLTKLPEWSKVAGRRWLPRESFTWSGWDDAEPLGGKAGVQLLAAMTDLDPECRISTDAALQSAYFQSLLPSHHQIQPSPRGASVWCQLVVPDAAWCTVHQRAFQHYIARDVALERSRELVWLEAARAVSASLVGPAIPELCKHICDFAFGHGLSAFHSYSHAENINTRMRAILIDWLLEVSQAYWSRIDEEAAWSCAVEIGRVRSEAPVAKPQTFPTCRHLGDERCGENYALKHRSFRH